MEFAKRVYRLSVMALVLLTAMETLLFIGSGVAAETEIIVFAAGSTTNAVTEIADLYAARNPARVKTSFASSSTLAKQIVNGAPADVFLSADKEWMDFLEEKNGIVKESRFDLLGNRIVLIAPKNSPLEQINVSPGFALAVMLGADGRLATGDPDHVPVGMYGKAALQNLGVWDRIKDRLAPMKDVRAALVVVERGEAPLGLVYATDAAISEKVRVVGTFPADSHPPIVYPVAATAGGKVSEAGKFLDFLRSPQARAVFEKYGFSVR